MSFPDETWHLEHLSFFSTIFFWIFLDFTIHGGIKRAKTRMCTFQHFFHECKWHWHIGDVFLNILVSYLHFSDLVWISYEVFKLTVKRSKGKSIRGAKWLGQNRWLLGIRGKTDEWDTTRGINLIIPKEKPSSYLLGFSSSDLVVDRLCNNPIHSNIIKQDIVFYTARWPEPG